MKITTTISILGLLILTSCTATVEQSKNTGNKQIQENSTIQPSSIPNSLSNE